jgi:hypothetical protein
LKKYKPNDKVSIEYIRDNINKKTELVLGSYKGTTFTQLENERGKDFSENASNVNIPLKDIEPTIQPRL